MGTTPAHALPYPELADPADAPKGFRDLATAVDSALLPATTVANAATRVIANLLAASDPQPAFRILGNGRIEWGAGGAAAPDTSLYRLGAGDLRTDADFSVRPNTPSWVIAGSRGPGGAAGLQFGLGLDVALYRVGGQPWFGLKTDQTFEADEIGVGRGSLGETWVGAEGPQGQAGIVFGTAYDANLYRLQTNVLKTDGGFQAGGSITTNGRLTISSNWAVPVYSLIVAPTQHNAGSRVLSYAIQGEAQSRFVIDADAAHSWGPGGGTAPDTNLYRASGGVLKTDGSFQAGSNVQAGSSVFGGAGLTFAGDTNLYRAGAGAVKTDGAMYVASDLTAHHGASSQIVAHDVAGRPQLSFGNSLDTALYRVQAGMLRTDGDFSALGIYRGNRGSSGQGVALMLDNGSWLTLRWDGPSGTLHFNIDGVPSAKVI